MSSEHHRPHLDLHTQPSAADIAAEQRGEGGPHPRQTALAAASLVLGVIAFAFVFFPQDSSAHWAGVVLGIAGVGVSIYAQLVSVTTAERWTIVPGWVLAVLAIGLNLFFA